MPVTAEQAYEIITAHVDATWPIVAATILTPAPPMRYEDIENGELPKTAFARFSMRPVMEGQATLRDGVFKKRYTAEGLIFVQVFYPRHENTPRAEEYTRRLAHSARDMFRGRELEGCIWFRNCRAVKLDPENKYHRWNAVAEYRYDEIA